ncbi:MAG: phage shock protein operon transcriptional activator [Pseudobacteriovorax sp.]|nr:phage shock protein operon transcriptional activator [Pseudobacteriovorax sp.]
MQSPSSFIGHSEAFLDLMEHVAALAKTEFPVVIYGERGTGKELVAERLHYHSGRWQEPLVKVNCAAIKESLLEAELFGYEVGAFTGAQKRYEGKFARANGGTLFLDEIHTASLNLQEKLLRVVEYGEFEPLGGRETLQAHVRLVTATNQNLRQAVSEGRFRADLLDRLCFDVIAIPALRERPADIMPLAEHFAMKMSQLLAWEHFPGFAAAAESALEGYAWPGNVRELKTTVERSLFHHQAGSEEAVSAIRFDPFTQLASEQPQDQVVSSEKTNSPSEADKETSTDNESGAKEAGIANEAGLAASFSEQVRAYEIQLLEDAMAKNRYNQTACSQALGLSYHQLRNLLKKYDIARSPVSSSDELH